MSKKLGVYYHEIVNYQSLLRLKPLIVFIQRLKRVGFLPHRSVMDEPSGIEEYRETGFQALWLPTTGGKPPTVEQVKQFVQFAEPLLEENQPVVVHCTSGNRRTGTLLAAYLVAKGEQSKKALSLLGEVRPTAELREAQREFLLELPRFMN